MTSEFVRMAKRKRIALIAHDNRKTDILDWAVTTAAPWDGTSCLPREPPAQSWRRSWVCRSRVS